MMKEVCFVIVIDSRPMALEAERYDVYTTVVWQIPATLLSAYCDTS